MSMLDRFGRLAGRLGTVLQERVGDFVEETLLSDEVRSRLQSVEQSIAHQRWDEALATLDRLEASKPGLARCRILRGVVYLEQGKVIRAVHYLESALQQRESNEAYYFLALARERQQRFGDARDSLLSALRSDRDSSLLFELLFALGRIYISMGRHDKGARELRRALKVRHADEEALTLLATSLRHLERIDEGITLLEEHRDQLKHPFSWTLFGQLYLSVDRQKSAAECFEIALRGDPNETLALQGAATCAIERGNFGAAKSFTERARRLAPEEIAVLLLRGVLALHSRKFDQAEGLFQRLLIKQPQHTRALVGLGQVALGRRELFEGERYFQRALALAPEDRAALLGAAQVHIAQGDRTAAMRMLERARHGAPLPQLFTLLGALAELAKNPIEAIVYYGESLKIGGAVGDNQEVRDALLGKVSFNLKWPDDPDPGALRDALERLRLHMSSEPLLQTHLPRLNDLIVLQDTPLRIAIMGEFNAGKSTLINAYLGEDVVPTGVLPTTAHINVIRYGPRKSARLIYASGKISKELPLSEARILLVESDEAIESIEFTYPHPTLRILQFIDTPGFNAANAAHEATARRALSEADALLWVVDVNQALSETQREVLSKIEGGAEKTLVLLNKVDHLDPEDEKELLEYLEKGLKGLARGVLPISSLIAAKARIKAIQRDEEPSPERLEAARWPAFVEVLNRDFIERSARLKAAEVQRRLHALIREILGEQDKNSSRLSLLAKQMEEGEQALQRAGELFEERALLEERHCVDRQHDMLLTLVARELEEARRPSAQWFSEQTLDQEDLRFLLDLIRKRMGVILDSSEQRVLQQVSESVEATMQTLEWIAKVLSPEHARALFQRLDAFVAEEGALRKHLKERVYQYERAHLTGRLEATIEHHSANFPEELGAEKLSESERKRWLSRSTGAPSERLITALRKWAKEYFGAAARLCADVRRDIEGMHLELLYRVKEPLSSVLPSKQDSKDPEQDPEQDLPREAHV